MKRFAAFALLAVLAAPALPAGATPGGRAAIDRAASPAGRVVLITLDGTSLDDWTVRGGPALRATIGHGMPGLLSARTGRSPAATRSACSGRTGDALATMLLGRRSTSSDLTGAEPLRAALSGGGISTGLTVPSVVDASFPTGRRTDVHDLVAAMLVSRDRFMLIRIPDTLAADCAGGDERDRWVGVALARVDVVVNAARSLLGPGDRLIVLSSAAPWRRERTKNYLAAAVLDADGAPANEILTSSATRRRGIVSLTDVATTVTALFGLDERIGVGRPWKATAGSLLFVRRASRDFGHASAIRSPMMRFYVWMSLGLLLLAAIVVLAGRGRARGGRIPRTARDWLAVALAAVVAVPLGMTLEPLAGASSPAASIAVAGGIALAVAGIAGVIAGMRGALAVCAAASAATIVAFLGSGELGARSALSYSVASGDRLFGIGNEIMGVVVAASLIATASWSDRRGQTRARLPATAGLLLAGAMALPATGAKFGSLFVIVPAFGFAAVRAGGRRIGREHILGIAIVTVALAGVIAAWDLLANPAAQSHVARAAGDAGTLGRKLTAAVRLAAGSYWTAAIAIPGLAAAVLVRRRGALLARGLWGRPAFRSALIACVIAAGAAVVFNDAGIVAAGLIALIACASLLHALLVGQVTPPRSSARRARIKEFLS